jgi:hypothetical protein
MKYIKQYADNIKSSLATLSEDEIRTIQDDAREIASIFDSIVSATQNEISLLHCNGYIVNCRKPYETYQHNHKETTFEVSTKEEAIQIADNWMNTHYKKWEYSKRSSFIDDLPRYESPETKGMTPISFYRRHDDSYRDKTR